MDYAAYEMRCGWCGKSSANVSSYSILHVLFVIFFIHFRVDTAISCPSCMRNCLLQRSLLNIVTANLLCPIVLVWNGFQFLRTLLK
jgi:hypothetical protein